jgi:soluble lytic murein transglycosylase
VLPALLLALAPATPALAQPWASEGQRIAGRQALAAAGAGRFLEADSVALAADPLARKLVAWLRVQTRGSGATGAEIAAWLEANPDWPLPDTIARRAEEALANDPDDALVLRHFARIPPRTVEAAQRFADALSRANRGREAASVLREAWRSGPPGAEAAEAAFADRNAAALGADDHWRRFDRLLWENQAGAAARLLPRLDAARRPAAEARLALRGDREPDGAARLRDFGVAHERARLLRRRDRDAEAAAAWAAAEPLQRGLAPEAARIAWAERQVLSRKLLRLGDPATAYRVAAGHGIAEPGEPRQEAEFLAGFIALRRLNDAAAAQRHFARIDDDSRSVITRARAAYWEGLALAALNREAEARSRWQAAAALPVAFYGQLASRSLGETPQQLAARIAGAALPEPAIELAQRFGARELSRAVVTLADLGASDRARTFLLRMEDVAAEASDRWLVARLASSSAGATSGLGGAPRRRGRRDPARGWLAHPLRHAGRRGGAGAGQRHHAAGEQFRARRRLLGQCARADAAAALHRAVGRAAPRHPAHDGDADDDAAHNLRLGSAYINDMLARYGGAMPLAAAAYNAGPGRVDEWLGTYGDPRVPGGVHILDWIEGIPFSETRNYVQRVIENVVVYRARNPATATCRTRSSPCSRAVHDHHHRFRARDGLELAARDHPGPEGRTPILCLPGLTRSAAISTARRAHAGTRRVIALDHAGHGESARPGGDRPLHRAGGAARRHRRHGRAALPARGDRRHELRRHPAMVLGVLRPARSRASC